STPGSVTPWAASSNMSIPTSSAVPTACITWFIPGTTPSSNTSLSTMRGCPSVSNDQPLASPHHLRDDHLPAAASLGFAPVLAYRATVRLVGGQFHSAGRVVPGGVLAQPLR